MTDPCSQCGRDMKGLIGLSISIAALKDDDKFSEVYPEITRPYHVDLCWVCWLRSMHLEIK